MLVSYPLPYYFRIFLRSPMLYHIMYCRSNRKWMVFRGSIPLLNQNRSIIWIYAHTGALTCAHGKSISRNGSYGKSGRMGLLQLNRKFLGSSFLVGVYSVGRFCVIYSTMLARVLRNLKMLLVYTSVFWL